MKRLLQLFFLAVMLLCTAQPPPLQAKPYQPFVIKSNLPQQTKPAPVLLSDFVPIANEVPQFCKKVYIR